ncbi:MAG: PqqD family protein [Candidatus Omnitrophica bacterium]|nr:PqqD family protein [Candidatus Omnitrophota bacterium]
MKTKIPVKSGKTASRIIDGEAVIVLLDKQETIVLSDVGSRIWEIMDGKRNIDEISAAVISEFDATHEEALKDITEFIEDMVQRGAVEIK